MIVRDYHGFTVDDALADVDRLVGEIRLQYRKEDVELITGHGIIRTHLMHKLRRYKLYPTTKLGNPGVIKVIVE